MADRTYHISQIVGTSNESMDAAIRNGIAHASKTIGHITWFEVVEVTGHVHGGEVDHIQVAMKVGYRMPD